MVTRRKTNSWKKDFSKYKYLYLMAVPMVVYYVLFNYIPMYGAIIAFKDFSAALGTWQSKWAGASYFRMFFKDVYFSRILRNTIQISLLDLAFGFPAPIILALLINEVRKNWFKKMVQTVTYVPHFISMMVIAGLIIDFTSRDGAINDVLALFGVERKTMLLVPGLFQPFQIPLHRAGGFQPHVLADLAHAGHDALLRLLGKVFIHFSLGFVEFFHEIAPLNQSVL